MHCRIVNGQGVHPACLAIFDVVVVLFCPVGASALSLEPPLSDVEIQEPGFWPCSTTPVGRGLNFSGPASRNYTDERLDTLPVQAMGPPWG